MNQIRRTLSFGKSKKAAAPASAAPEAALPSSGATRAPAPQPASSGGGLSRKIKRSLSFQGSSSRKAAQQPAAAVEAIPAAPTKAQSTPVVADGTARPPFPVTPSPKRISAKEFAAGANVHELEELRAPAVSVGGGRPLTRRASSFGRQAKPAAVPPAAPPPPQPIADLQMLHQKKEVKQDLAASQLQRYLQKMTEIDPTPEEDAMTRPGDRQQATRTPEDDLPRLLNSGDAGSKQPSPPALRADPLPASSAPVIHVVASPARKPGQSGMYTGRLDPAETDAPPAALPADFGGADDDPASDGDAAVRADGSRVGVERAASASAAVPDISDGAAAGQSDGGVKPQSFPPPPPKAAKLQANGNSSGAVRTGAAPPPAAAAPPPSAAAQQPLPKRTLNLFKADGGVSAPATANAANGGGAINGDSPDSKPLSLRRRSTVDTASGVTIIGDTAHKMGSSSSSNGTGAATSAAALQVTAKRTLGPVASVSAAAQPPSVVNLKDVTPAADGRSLSLPVQGVIMPSSPAGGFGGGGAAQAYVTAASPGICYMPPATAGAGGAVAPPNGMRLTVQARPAPDASTAFEPTASTAESKPSGGLGIGLKKRLSFGRSKTRKDAAVEPPPPKPAAPPKSAVPTEPSASSRSPNSAGRSPKADGGEMDDDELENYLRDLELNHENNRSQFEKLQND